MKPTITLAALASLFLLAGCASTPPPDTSTSRNLDHAYVSAVDRQAKKAGVRVFWVNPPRKKDRQRGDNQP